MAKKKENVIAENTEPTRKRRSVEAQESLCIALAYDLVEQRIRDGSATSQETTHFLKMGSTHEKRERDLMEKKIKLLEKQVEALEASKRMEALYADAIKAVTSYRSPVLNGGYDEMD